MKRFRFLLLLLILAGSLFLVSFLKIPQPGADRSAHADAPVPAAAWFEGTWKVEKISSDGEREPDQPENQYYTFGPNGAGQFSSMNGSSDFCWIKQGNRLEVVNSDRSVELFYIGDEENPTRLVLTREPETLRWPFDAKTITTILWRP